MSQGGLVYDENLQWFETETSRADDVLAHVPGAAIVAQGGDWPIVRVPWDQHSCEVLANLRAPHLPPMLRDYTFAGDKTPFPHQYRIAGAMSTHSKFFCLADMGCVDADTEYLSPTGWIRIADYKGGEVAQYHPSTGAAEFVEPLEYVTKPCEEMFWFAGPACDQMLSPEHRVLLADGTVISALDAAGLIERGYQWEFPTLSASGRATSVQKVAAPGGMKYCFMVPSSFLVFRRNGKVFCSGNTGKTLSALWAIDYLFSIGAVRQVLVVCPKSIVRNAWLKEIVSTIPHRSASVLVHTDPKVRRLKATSLSDIHITNYSGIEICYEEMVGRYDLIVIDECFVAGTPVSTPDGEVAIETLRVGDYVTTEFGPQKVQRVGRRLAQETINLELSNGGRITCTPEHPFFTDRGWVAAKHSAGSRLLDHADVSCLLGRVPAQHGADTICTEAWDEVGDVLREILRSEVSPPDGPCVHGEDIGGDACEPVDNAAWGLHQDRGPAGSQPRTQAEDGAAAHRAGWERPDGPVRGSGGCGDVRVDTTACGPIGRAASRLSHMLQARLRHPGATDRHRAGRWVASEPEGSSTGCEEGREAGGTWVVRVSCPEHDGPVEVFNLTVARVPHFFAGGVLTHNCTAYKKYGTRRWKFMRPLVAEAARCWMLTGTPSVQYPLDAYGQVKLMYQDDWPVTESAFKSMTMIQHSKYRWVPMDDAASTVHEAMQPAIVVHKRDVLQDLPPVTHSTRTVELSAEQKRLMKELRKEAIVEAQCGAVISAVHAAALRTKLLQVASGVVYDDNRQVVDIEFPDRINELVDIVEQVRAQDDGTGPPAHKVIVVCAFTHTVDRVHAELQKRGFNFGKLYGDVSLTRREKILTSMETTREFDGIVAHPEVLSHGVTLISCTTTVMFTPFDKAEVALQVQNRMDRPGQKHPMQIIRLSGCAAEDLLYERMDMRFDFHSDVVHKYGEFVDVL